MFTQKFTPDGGSIITTPLGTHQIVPPQPTTRALFQTVQAIPFEYNPEDILKGKAFFEDNSSKRIKRLIKPTDEEYARLSRVNYSQKVFNPGEINKNNNAILKIMLFIMYENDNFYMFYHTYEMINLSHNGEILSYADIFRDEKFGTTLYVMNNYKRLSMYKFVSLIMQHKTNLKLFRKLEKLKYTPGWSGANNSIMDLQTTIGLDRPE